MRPPLSDNPRTSSRNATRRVPASSRRPRSRIGPSAIWFAWRNFVGGCLQQFERIRHTGRNREIVHLIVENQSQFRDHHLGAEDRIDSSRDDHDVALAIDHTKIGGAVIMGGRDAWGAGMMQGDGTCLRDALGRE